MWVERYLEDAAGFAEVTPPRASSALRRGWMLDRSGRFCATRTLQEGFELKAVADGTAVRIFRNDLGVESVQAYEAMPPPV